MIKTVLHICLLAAAMNGCGGSAKTPEATSPDRVVVAYVTSWSDEIPDPALVTHINYAFGQVKNSDGKWNGIDMGAGSNDNNPGRLKQMVELKKTKPSLKVLLSIGGWGADGFSQMAANDTWRAEFAADCKRVIDEFGLDGVDLDWEYPTSTQAGIVATPQDRENFTKLVREIRAHIGPHKLLTLASAASDGNYDCYDWKAIDPYMDFYNIMTYDLGNPPAHHSALYRFGDGGAGWAERAVDRHIEMGAPVGKLTLGIPFYGRSAEALVPGGGNFVPYGRIAGLISDGAYAEAWDEEAKAPYLVDGSGTMVCSYDNPRSVAIKCARLLERGMLGAMYWDYSQDDGQGTMRRAVWEGVMARTE